MIKTLTSYGLLLSGKINNVALMLAATEYAESLGVSVHELKCYPDLGKLAGGRYALCLEANRAPWLASLAA